YHEINLPVTIDVAGSEGGRNRASRESLRSGKRSVSIAQQHRNVIGDSVGGGQVQDAVAVEVGGHQRCRASASQRQALLSLECPIAVAQQHRHPADKSSSGNEIQHSVAVEVGDDDCRRAAGGREGPLRAKVATTRTQEDKDTGALTADGQ